MLYIIFFFFEFIVHLQHTYVTKGVRIIEGLLYIQKLNYDDLIRTEIKSVCREANKENFDQ